MIKNNNFVVNILTCTYNHEKYIAQTIEGVLKQKTNFSFQHIIGEDASTDNTLSIIQFYADKHPNKIKLIAHPKNIGAFENTQMLFANVNAKYVALCDGDDYWTDEHKLQKQVDFLEANPEYAICFHRIFEKNELDETKSCFSPIHSRISTFEDLIRTNNYIHTVSCMFRNHLFGKFPEWFSECEVGDYVLHLLNAQYGKIYFMEDAMAVYRINSQSTWASKNDSYRYSKWLKLLLFLSTKFDSNIGELIFENIYEHIIRCKKLQIDISEFTDALTQQECIKLIEKGQLLYAQKEENLQKSFLQIKNSYESTIDYYRNSFDYKFGNILIQPLRAIKNLLNL